MEYWKEIFKHMIQEDYYEVKLINGEEYGLIIKFQGKYNAFSVKFGEVKAVRMIDEGIDIVNFSAGEPDFNTPDYIKEAAIEAINDNFTKYTPYEGIVELRQAVADDLKKNCDLDYTPEQIVISNGSKHAITNAFMAILNPGDEVIVPAPYWNSYIDIIELCYGVPVVVNTTKQNSFKVTVEDHESTTETSPVTTTTTTTASGQPTPSGAVLYGDTNLDGRVDITDAVLLNKACAGAVMLDDATKKNADCNGDSEVGSDDAVVLMQFLVHIVDKLPYQN